MSFGRGYIRDAREKRVQRAAHHLLGVATGFPLAASLEQFEAPIMNQGQTGSCTGHGTAQGIVTAFAAKGDPMPFVPSPAGIYTVGRCVGRAPGHDGALAPLTDSGAMPADVMAGISLWGVRPMGAQAPGRFSDQLDSRVNDEPTLGDLEDDAETLLVGEFRIDETAPDVVEQVCRAIAQGYPVGVGIFVDSAFENYAPGAVPIGAPNVNDPNGGGHWIVLTSYVTNAVGRRVFRGPNSWGPGWGDSGHFVASEEWVRAAWDLYCLNVSRKP